jgi:undecaprenyl-diphosphatase
MSEAHPAIEPALPRMSILRRTFANLAAWIGALGASPRPSVRPPLWPPASRLAIGATITIAVVGVLMVALDPLVALHHRSVPAGLFSLFDELTDFGESSWFLIPTGALLVVIAALASPALGRTSHLVLTSLAVRLGFVFVAIALPSLVVTIVKRLIGRARPLRVDGWDIYFAPFSWRADFASMPSGHSTTAFAAAVALGALFPRARPALFLYAGLIAISRVVLTAHYPSDVVAGAVVGACGALIVRSWFAARRLGFRHGVDGTIRALPGPSLQRIKKVARRLCGQ